MPTKLFDEKKLTSGEQEFISNVLNDDIPLTVITGYLMKAQTLATLRLAKEIEESNKSSSFTAWALNGLTLALVLVAAIQVLIQLKIIHP